jgi:hypothetical protein
MSSTSFRVERASTGRAACKFSGCKTTIPKNELRMWVVPPPPPPPLPSAWRLFHAGVTRFSAAAVDVGAQ